MRSRVVATAQAVAIGLLLSACAPGVDTPPASPSPTPSASVSEPATEPPVPMDPSAPSGQCADHALRVTIEPNPEGDSTGHVVWNVVFTNTGSSSCELRGAPSVAVIDASGTVIGASASSLEGPAPETITIEPGGQAIAGLSVADIGDDGGPLGEECPTVTGSAYRILPPHGFTPSDIPGDVPACDGEVPWMTVTVVRAG